MRYRPKFQPLWLPEIALKLTTSDHSDHFPFSTSIQCAVIPRNNNFVLSAVHPSAVLDILPGAAWSHFISALTLMGYLFTYQDVILQALQPLDTAVVDVDGNVVRAWYI
jgi:hypothetical protein